MAATTDTELLTEHFGYPPVSLLDDVINSVNILAERALNSVEQALLRRPPASLGFKPDKKAVAAAGSVEAAEAAAAEAHRHEVENGTHQLETLLCASIDRNFDKFELYAMRNILCVRPEDRDWIRLAHYDGLDLDAVDDEGHFLPQPLGPEDSQSERAQDLSDAGIAHLHRRLQASLQLGVLLAAETARNEALLAQLHALAGDGKKADRRSSANADKDNTDPDAEHRASLAFLLDRGPLTESDAAAPLTTTTAFALSQLPALRQLSGVLRHMAPGLADENGRADADAGSRDKDAESWRRERLEYIEGGTRRHLERVRGLGLGRNGEVVGPGAGGGTSEAAVEPEALTNILSILREHKAPGAAAAAVAAQAADADDGDVMDES